MPEITETALEEKGQPVEVKNPEDLSMDELVSVMETAKEDVSGKLEIPAQEQAPIVDDITKPNENIDNLSEIQKLQKQYDNLNALNSRQGNEVGEVRGREKGYQSEIDELKRQLADSKIQSVEPPDEDLFYTDQSEWQKQNAVYNASISGQTKGNSYTDAQLNEMVDRRLEEKSQEQTFVSDAYQKLRNFQGSHNEFSTTADIQEIAKHQALKASNPNIADHPEAEVLNRMSGVIDKAVSLGLVGANTPIETCYQILKINDGSFQANQMQAVQNAERNGASKVVQGLNNRVPEIEGGSVIQNTIDINKLSSGLELSNAIASAIRENQSSVI